jgi:hypothetical protein
MNSGGRDRQYERRSSILQHPPLPSPFGHGGKGLLLGLMNGAVFSAGLTLISTGFLRPFLPSSVTVSAIVQDLSVKCVNLYTSYITHSKLQTIP